MQLRRARGLTGEDFPGEQHLGNSEDGHGILVEHRSGDGRLDHPGVDRHRSVDAGDVEGKSTGAGILGRQGGLHRVDDGLQRAKGVVGMEHVEAENHCLAVCRQGLQPLSGGQIREGFIGWDKDGDPRTVLVGLELRRDAGRLQHRRRDVEIMPVDENVCDVHADRRPRLGGSEVEARREQQRVHGEDRYVVRQRADEGEDGRVGGGEGRGRACNDGAADAVASREVHGSEVACGATRGLIECGDELTAGGDAAEVRPREVLEEDVVA